MAPNEAAKKISDQILIGPGELSTLPIIQQAIATATAELTASIQGALADAGTVLAIREDGRYDLSIRELTKERDDAKAKLDAAEKLIPAWKEQSLKAEARGRHAYDGSFTAEASTLDNCADELEAALKGNGQ